MFVSWSHGVSTLVKGQRAQFDPEATGTQRKSLELGSNGSSKTALAKMIPKDCRADTDRHLRCDIRLRERAKPSVGTHQIMVLTRVTRDRSLRIREPCSSRRRPTCSAFCYYASRRLPHAHLHLRMPPCANRVRIQKQSCQALAKQDRRTGHSLQRIRLARTLATAHMLRKVPFPSRYRPLKILFPSRHRPSRLTCRQRRWGAG